MSLTYFSPTIVMEHYKDNWSNENTIPEKQLKVIIVGAGIAGLAAAIGT